MDTATRTRRAHHGRLGDTGHYPPAGNHSIRAVQHRVRGATTDEADGLRSDTTRPEEIIGKLREAEVVLAQGATTAEACRRIAVSEQTYYRWRKEYGGLKTDQARRMKDLEKENLRLRRAISDLTLDKLIIQEAARGNF